MAQGPFPYTDRRYEGGYGPSHLPPAAFRTDGVLTRRLLAYAVDAVVLTVLFAVLWTAIAILGVVTLSLGWFLFPVLAVLPVAYNAITIAGSSQGTVGMRVMGLRVIDAGTGGRVDLVRAAVHALLFYVALGSFGILLVIDILVGVFRADRRMARDLALNVALVRER
jgi:uncharacterized RDD family membrane protein YckC